MSRAGYGTNSGYSSAGQYAHSQERLNPAYEPVNPGTPNKEYYPPYSPIAQQSAPSKGGRKKWLWIGVPIAILVIAGAVVGGVVGSRSGNSSTSSAAASNSGGRAGGGTTSNGGSTGGATGGSTAADPTSAAFALPPLDANGNPIYTDGPVSAPSITSALTDADCGADPFTATGSTSGTGTGIQVRPGHPRLIAAQYQWDCLSRRIQTNGYLAAWNATIMQNATDYLNMPVATYVFDGGPAGSGALDVARETQLRVKLWAYAYRMTNDTRWTDRMYRELEAMSGDGNAPGTAATAGTAGDPWNTAHFLDVAEFTAAYAYAYDWAYNAWTAAQRTSIRGWIVANGLSRGITAYGTGAFWQAATGNWNCVCTNGLTAGALAIWDEDTTNTAQRIVALTIPNALAVCAQAISSDGTWLETSDYYYFGITGHSTLAANLRTATGSDQGFYAANQNLNISGLFHIYGTGFVEKFNWGDCGPNKYTATANALLLQGNLLSNPRLTLYQRDRIDASEPFSMLYFDPKADGTWWAGLPLDRHFDNVTTAWAAMRGSWTNTNAIYAAIKAGSPLNKQTHSNLDAGTFVFEALGQRWAGELCQDNYLFPGYFGGDEQGAQRWTYYRCGTSGQNTILLGGANQNVNMMPPTHFDSTNDVQTSLGWQAPSSSQVYFWTDLSTAYGGQNIQRGMRLVAGRQAMLLRDELTGTNNAAQWRVHTNATISTSADQRTATLALNGQQVVVTIRSPATATFGTAAPAAAGTNELGNPGVTVLTIAIPAGTNTLETLWAPSWNGTAFNAGTIPDVALAQWSTTSH